MTYDSLGHVIKEIYYDGNATSIDSQQSDTDDTALLQKRTEYDGMGRTITQVVMANAANSNGYSVTTDKVTRYTYDSATDPIVRNYPGALVVQTTYYNNVSNAVETFYDYDDLGRRIKTTDPDDNETIIEYDKMGRVTRRQQKDYHPTTSTKDIVQTTDYEYDDLGRLTKLKNAVVAAPDPQDDNDWMITTYEYALSMRLKVTKPNGVETAYEYDNWGHRVKTVADADYAGHTGLKQRTDWGFDRLGRQVSITGYTGADDGGTSQTTTYDYDGAGRVVTITYPDTKTITFTYNAGNKVATRRDQRYDGGNGWYETVYTYDDNYNLTEKEVTDADDVDWLETFTFDGLNRMLTADKTKDAADISLVEFVYNDIGKITDFDQTHFGGTERQIDYEYDQAGFLVLTTYPGGSTTITRTNDWRGRIDTLDRSSTELVDYDYIGARVAKRSYDTPDVAVDFDYDNLGRITTIDYTESIVKFDYTYESDENNIDKKYLKHRGANEYNDYDYDDLDRLTGVTYLDDDTEAFNMDNLGNRGGNQTLRDDGTVNFTVDHDTNRYTSIGGNVITHDEAGNTTTDKDGYTYEYDYENRIVKIEDSSSNDVAEYSYDALGRRIRVIDSKASATTLFYYNPEWQVLAEYDSAGELQRYFVYGNYIDEPLVMHRESDDEDYYYAHDHLYSTAAIIGTDSQSWDVVERYEYDAYGKVTVYTDYGADEEWLTADDTTSETSNLDNPYTFTSRRLDMLDSDSLEVMYYRHRAYDTYVGRFLQHDPFGINPAGRPLSEFRLLMQYRDGLNLYDYCSSLPGNSIDPMGTYSTLPVPHLPGAGAGPCVLINGIWAFASVSAQAAMDWIVNEGWKNGGGEPQVIQQLRNMGWTDADFEEAKDTLEFFHLDRLAANPNDKWTHCVVSCKIARRCKSVLGTALIGIINELIDVFGPEGASLGDLKANAIGLGCSKCAKGVELFWRLGGGGGIDGCEQCCGEFYAK